MPGTPASRARPAATVPRARGGRAAAGIIITDEKLTKASGEDNSDPADVAEFLAAEHASQDAGGGTALGGPEPSGWTPGRQPLSWYPNWATFRA